MARSKSAMRAVDIALGGERDAAVIIGEREDRADPGSPARLPWRRGRNRAGRASSPRGRSGDRVVRVELDPCLEVGDRVLDVVLLVIGDAAVMQGERIFGVELDAPG